MAKYVDLELNLNSRRIFHVHKFLVVSRSKKFEMLIKAKSLQTTINNEESNFDSLRKTKRGKFNQRRSRAKRDRNWH